MRQLDKAEWKRKVARIKNYHSRYELILNGLGPTRIWSPMFRPLFPHGAPAAQNRSPELNAVTGDHDVYVEGRNQAPFHPMPSGASGSLAGRSANATTMASGRRLANRSQHNLRHVQYPTKPLARSVIRVSRYQRQGE